MCIFIDRDLPFEIVFAGILIICAVIDFWRNYDYYFGYKEREAQATDNKNK